MICDVSKQDRYFVSCQMLYVCQGKCTVYFWEENKQNGGFFLSNSIK